MRTRVVTVLVSLAALTAAGVGVSAGAAQATSDHGRHAKRVCAASSSPTVASCSSQVMVSDKTGAVPNSASPAASAMTPAQIRDAYKLTGLNSGGRTVAVVDAYGYPNLERDLGVYRQQFGLAPCTTANGCLKVVNQTGGRTLPRYNTGWAGEQALDVDAVSAACPDCKILVVQATSASVVNLGIAVNTAAAGGVAAISNSYGAGDLADSSYGSYFNHPGIAVTASTGDNGYQGGSFPSSSKYVTAVGGTSLVKATSTSRGWSESAWSGAGSGCSNVNDALAAAAGSGTGCAKRAIADVSAAADPGKGGLAVYWPTTKTSSTWAQVGGTSESAPIIAAVYALAGSFTGYGNAIPYGHTSALFDVTSGSNGSCSTAQLCGARAGWDGPTGLGTPNGIGGF